MKSSMYIHRSEIEASDPIETIDITTSSQRAFALVHSHIEGISGSLSGSYVRRLKKALEALRIYSMTSVSEDLLAPLAVPNSFSLKSAAPADCTIRGGGDKDTAGGVASRNQTM